jgi:putative Mg2+ transporter-C (MgtC) family protein
MLITFGSALFTVLSEFLATLHGGDPQRIAAQLIPGIGFLGAGAIIQARGTIVGLTTAALIFVMASVGMAAGGGMNLLAIACTLLLLLLIVPMEMAERRLETKAQVVAFSFETRQPESCVANLQEIARGPDITVRDLHLRQAEDHCKVEFSLEVPGDRLAEAVRRVHDIRKLHA